MKVIRVLQVFTIMNRGGAESMIMNYYRNIDRTKVQFDFLVHRIERGAFDDEIESLGGNIFRMLPITLKGLKVYQNELELFFKKHNEYTIVHSHLNALSKYVLRMAMEFGINTRIAHSHIALAKFSYQSFFKSDISFKEKFKILLKSYIKKSITKYATHYFACGRDAGVWLFGKENIEKVIVINNAIDTSKFEFNKYKSIENKESLGLKDKIVVGHIGRFNLQKNHDFLIDVFKEINKINSNSVLLLIGEGDLKETLIKKVKRLKLDDSVCFLGIQSDIPFYLQAMDVFLFPSLYEGLPVTLIEAQASGLKIIASDTISQEAKLTSLVEFISLNQSAVFWAKKVLQYNTGYNREGQFESISNKGYDIKVNALSLQNFYRENI
ncbi:glycosyltransferase family 1 protein [Lutibacter sp. A64]|uniref:glycosyltransferase family 1 protein n=1 Tax=Lutibacter sp. A64 TaxID=2918526 RepID=UPI001F05141E|nr:glycosyltransferase family 1 protein [Lutibacter sp. A64]UMB55460.1 glycosyltransferase family 1 protein [Lutibacter sp. A64]